MSKIYPKLIVTLAALALFFTHHWLKFDTVALGIIFIAILPWLSTFLQSAELPGGWKFQFQEVKAQQEQQRQDLERLKFLIQGFVTDDELGHLKKFNSQEPFLVKVDGTTKYFESELRRLRALGLLANPPGKGIGTLLINDGHERDAKAHFHITDKGREYLKFRNATQDVADEPIEPKTIL